jgi:tellurite resistance-related uncharacterized protein
MKTIPSAYAPYKRTPTFTQDTLPNSLQRAHNTKPDVWALIHVTVGMVRYVIHSCPEEVVVLRPGVLGVVEPEVMHHVEPVGPMQLFVEFHRLRE